MNPRGATRAPSRISGPALQVLGELIILEPGDVLGDGVVDHAWQGPCRSSAGAIRGTSAGRHGAASRSAARRAPAPGGRRAAWRTGRPRARRRSRPAAPCVPGYARLAEVAPVAVRDEIAMVGPPLRMIERLDRLRRLVGTALLDDAGTAASAARIQIPLHECSPRPFSPSTARPEGSSERAGLGYHRPTGIAGRTAGGHMEKHGKVAIVTGAGNGHRQGRGARASGGGLSGDARGASRRASAGGDRRMRHAGPRPRRADRRRPRRLGTGALRPHQVRIRPPRSAVQQRRHRRACGAHGRAHPRAVASGRRHQSHRRLPLHPGSLPHHEGPGSRAAGASSTTARSRRTRRGRSRRPTLPPSTPSPASPSRPRSTAASYDIACGQIDIGNAATEMTQRMRSGVLQANGEMAVEPRMDVAPRGERRALHGEPAARGQRAVHDGDGDQDAVRRPRLAAAEQRSVVRRYNIRRSARRNDAGLWALAARPPPTMRARGKAVRSRAAARSGGAVPRGTATRAAALRLPRDHCPCSF